MTDWAALLEVHPLPRLQRLLPPGPPCWLVGGALRDWLRGREVTDFDVAVAGDPTPQAQRFAAEVGGRWFLLDPVRAQSRVVFAGAGRPLTCDFTPLRAPTIAEDLALRDFTVNALALPLGEGSAAELLDPLHGQNDLQQGILRACSAQTFSDDPLRLLRGVRHCVTLELIPAAETVAALRAGAGLLPQAAPERILYELGLIFSVPRATAGLAALGELGLLAAVLGREVPGERLAELLALVARLEQGLARLQQEATGDWLEGWVQQPLQGSFTRRGALLLAAVLRTVAGTGEGGRLCRRLRLGNRLRTLVVGLGAASEQKLEEFAALPPRPRPRLLWAQRIGAPAAEILLWYFALAAGSQAAQLHAIVDMPWGNRRLPPLLSGTWVQQHLGLGAGPQVGAVLEQLALAEIRGEVATRDQAQTFLQRQQEKIRKK